MALLPGCGSDAPEIDDIYPTISTQGLFPQPCTVLERGKTHTFTVTFSDNIELGSFNFDIHHNFNHHSHSTSVEECQEDPVKDPVKPFTLIRDFTIPGGLKSYTASVPVAVPADVDEGDYHFRVDVTDKTGWQTIKTMSIKIK
ncbi:MAG: DUF4625 domain-containing protein [Leadbetterella sp.]|nr:DUF4625 domain-containing protein [Leadbetterella sp.]